jgi:hypothetical protein
VSCHRGAIEIDALLIYLRARETEDCSRRRRSGRLFPSDELVKPATTRNQLIAGPQHQVIGIAKNNARADLLKVLRSKGFDRALGADRHERRRLDRPVCGPQDTTPRGAIGVGKAKQKKSPDPLLSLSEEIASWDHLWRTFGRARGVRHVGIINF